MQRVVIDIPEKKINFFMELLNNLGIKEVTSSSIKGDLEKDLKYSELSEAKFYTVNEANEILDKVKDSDLILAFKNLLKQRKEKSIIETDFDLSISRALLDKHEGRTKPHKQIRKKYEKWL